MWLKLRKLPRNVTDATLIPVDLTTNVVTISANPIIDSLDEILRQMR